MTTTVRKSHINFTNIIIIIIIMIIISKTVGISVKQTFWPMNQTIFCMVLLFPTFVMCCSCLGPSRLDSYLPNICCKSVPSFDIGFSLCRLCMPYFLSTVILPLNMVYFKSTALFMRDVTINSVARKCRQSN